jgi:hypothetical protein
MDTEQLNPGFEQVLGVRRRAPWILLCFVLATGVTYRFSSYVVG